jgi:hypothetical protein
MPEFENSHRGEATEVTLSETHRHDPSISAVARSTTFSTVKPNSA